MGKEIKRKKQKKLIKNVLIGIGIAGTALLVIRTLIHRKPQKNECPGKPNVGRPILKNCRDAYEKGRIQSSVQVKASRGD